MALKRLKALAAAYVLDLNYLVSRRRRKLGWVVGEGYWLNVIAIAFKRLEVLAAARVLDFNYFVVWRQRKLGQVVGEGY